MFGLSVNQAKASFFDRAAVERDMDRKTKRNFSRFGAFVRTRARSSIRKRKKASAPGTPPSSHVGTLRGLILFSYDAARRSVVIGPTLLNSGKGEAPRLNEFGGQAVRFDNKGRSRTVTYPPRPFMRPAFEAELPRGLQLFRDNPDGTRSRAA